MMSPLQLFKTQHAGQTEMFWSVLAFLGSYGLRENANGSAESMAVSSQFDALGEIPIVPPKK